MSTPQTALVPEDTQPSTSATTTLVRAEPGLAPPAPDDLHPQVRGILKEAALRSGIDEPDLGLLLKLMSVQCEAMDAERRGIVQSMRLMADEAAELGHRVRESELTERVALASRAVLEQLTGTAPLAEILASITRFIEAVGAGTVCSIGVLASHAQAFSYLVSPRMPEKLHAALERCTVDIRNGSSAAAVYLGRQVLVADIDSDPFWQRPRELALAGGFQGAPGRRPIKAANGRLLGPWASTTRPRARRDAASCDMMAHAAQLAGIAIERRRGEEALRASEAQVPQSLRAACSRASTSAPATAACWSVNPAFVDDARLRQRRGTLRAAERCGALLEPG